MKFTYRAAQAMTVAAFVPACLPTVNGWAFNSPAAVACWLTAIVLICVPFAWDRYGPGLKLA